MGYAEITALILTIAVEFGLPPNFVLSIALIENDRLNPSAIGVNHNGTVDRGVMQLNSRYFSNIDWRCPETNIRAACEHIKMLSELPECNTWWSVAVAYNAGYGRLSNPPLQTLVYAERVMRKWYELNSHEFHAVIRK